MMNLFYSKDIEEPGHGEQKDMLEQLDSDIIEYKGLEAVHSAPS